MSDVLSDAQMYLSEPDETVLTAALRNKDDIPILMDVVGADEVTTPVSQEMHLKQLLSVDPSQQEVASEKPREEASSAEVPAAENDSVKKTATHFKYEPPESKKTEFKYEPPEETAAVVAEVVSSSVSQTAEKVATPAQRSSKTDQSQVIAAAIRSVLERRLPGLVAEVLTEISKRKGR